MSTDLQEINSILKTTPDLSANGVPREYAEAAWMQLHGFSYSSTRRSAPEIFTRVKFVNLQSKNFLKAVELLAPQYVRSTGVAVAVATLVSVAKDDKATASARVAAANSILDRTGYTEKAADSANADRVLREMSPEELQARIDKLEAERAEAAKDITPRQIVDNAPALERIDEQLSDLIG